MKIALYEAVRQEKLGNIFYPLGLGYIAAYLRKYIPEVEIEIFRSLTEVLDFDPDLVGISCMSANFSQAIFASNQINDKVGCPIILGGCHISSIPETLPRSFTAGVIGEGEQTFFEIVNLLKKTGKLSLDALFNIDGLVINDGSTLFLTKKRALIKKLDDIPYPARDWKYAYYNWSLTSRGCPYHCAFCFSALFWDIYRLNSPEYVVNELIELSKIKPLDYHTFLDDLFSADSKRMEEISYLVKEKFSNKIHFTVTARANMVNEEMAKILVDLGAEFVHLGLESGSDRILKYLKKDECSVATNQKALDILSFHGIKPIGTFIIGSPKETEEDILKTYSFIANNLHSNKLSSFSFGPLLPFPGTLIWQHAVSNGFINPERFIWDSLDVDVRNFDRSAYQILSTDISNEKFYYYFNKIRELLRTE